MTFCRRRSSVPCLILCLCWVVAPGVQAQAPSGVSAETTLGDGVYSAIEGTTAIVFLKPEGTRVKKGELVGELESFALKTRLAKQEIATRAAEVPYLNARGARESAESAVAEYVHGVYTPQLKLVESQISLATLQLKQAQAELESFKRLTTKGLGPKVRVTDAELNVQRVKLTLESAERKKATLEKYTKEKRVKELQSKVERARALELTRQAEFSREQTAEEQLRKEIALCQLRAPADGQVRYADQIEEGAEVRKGQLLFRVIGQDVAGQGEK